MKDEKTIARKVVECCHNNCFCAFEFILWDVNEEEELFYFYLQKMRRNGNNIEEIYTYNVLFSENWQNVVASVMEIYFAEILPQLSFSRFFYELEIIKRDEIKKRNLKIK